ncbi:triose-phosphate isomerase [Caulobacter segnis]|uniref:triose-phosphate isomerase n=1 Tax=Caulobacter segnis TaxID=88688 RepID=UPI001CC04A01|nr:triose-phosphate isomerase [Caulobacter segnis]UAL12377.1 triose-phosphate isomerase [Caulobacter segnis]
MSANPSARLIVGNWKMNGGLGLLDVLAAELAGGGWTGRAVVCPPATLLGEAHRRLAPLGVEVGGQDCHVAERGAHTGDLSAALLAATGARHVIVGHSERRAAYGEADLQVRDKTLAAVEAGLSPIVCVGDTAEDRASGRAVEVVTRQVGAVLDGALNGRPWVLAYEPVWAIGSGRAATADDIAEMHAALRAVVGGATPILYGGSVTADNAGEIRACPEVGGLLIGGASLRPDQFAAILRGC